MVARHKLVKNINLNGWLHFAVESIYLYPLVAHLDDDALSDGGEDYISDEHQALLNDGLERIREIVGGPESSGLSDATIKDIIWECEFDFEETLQWVLEEQEKNRQAQERKAQSHVMKDLPPIPEPPEQRELGYGEYSPPVLGPRPIIQEGDTVELEERSHVPLIVLAQQQLDPADLLSDEGGAPVKRNLSTITERTERTEIWRPQQRMSLNLPRPPSSVTTSYGRAVEPVPADSVRDSVDLRNSVDPDSIPLSPSGSALHRLSFYEPPPSLPPSEVDSYDSYEPPKGSSEPVPPLDTIPDIPDMNSKSSRQITQQPASQAGTGKKSKLAMLATSRATTSSIRSESSRSTGTDVVGSVKTYPDLRPTSQSIRPPASVTSTSTPSAPSSTSLHIQRAIQTAMEMAAGDRSTSSQGYSDGSRTPTPTLNRPSAPTPSKVPQMPTPSSSPPTTRQPSKLALLAQANKAARIAKQTPVPTNPPRLPEEHTEYLTPIANGPTVTTAITTSYQTLYSLTNPDRPPASTEPFVVPLSTSASATSAADAKKSKLAMKIKKAQEKLQPAPVAPEAPPPSIPPIFLPKPTRTRAAPSAFASLLVDDVPDDEATRLAKQRKLKGKQPEEPRHRSKGKQPTRIPDFYGPGGFAFDGPSPDDIVLNARRDTNLTQTRKAPPLASTSKT
ncbi:hypothetical protein K438DRAFT_1958558 [Mycena galopus ATCC 62051]|nr:hypothetical protein K438DRAFT_1958558 [Mycena galopus ATCC 62051]